MAMFQKFCSPEMALDLTKKMLGKGLLDAKQTTGTCYCSQQALEYELPPPQLIKMNQTTGPSYSPSNHHWFEILAGFLYKVNHSSKSSWIMCRSQPNSPTPVSVESCLKKPWNALVKRAHAANPCIQKKNNNTKTIMNHESSSRWWWFLSPIWTNLLVKFGNQFPKFRGEISAKPTT